MSEHARYNGRTIMIGTGEDMHYLRADQAGLVQALPGNVDPVKHAEKIRFRFRFPSEDRVPPGAFGEYDRSFPVYDVEPPKDIKHNEVEFQAGRRGILVMLPCPFSSEGASHRYMFTGLGEARIVQQRMREGRLLLVCECGGCRTRYSFPTLADAQPVIESLMRISEAERQDWNLTSAHTMATIARRITDGYTTEWNPYV